MKIRLRTFTFALLAAPVVQASEPIERMPIPGDWKPKLVEKVRDSEERIRATEQAKDEKTSPAKSASPSAFVKGAGERAAILLKDGDFAGASRAYQEALNEAVTHLSATDQALTDCFLTSFSAATGAEALELKGERALAKALYEEIVKALRKCRETMPEWKPTIVEYRLKKVEKQLAKLQ